VRDAAGKPPDRFHFLGLAQPLPEPRTLGFRALALGHVHDRPDEFEIARFISRGVGHNVEMFDSAIRHPQSMLVNKIIPVLRRALDCLFHEDRVFMMNPLQKKVYGRFRRSVVFEDSKRFL
jgi:hypothetical protein